MFLSIDYRSRVEKIQEALTRNNIDVIVATRQISLSHLTGVFNPEIWRAAVILPKTGKPFLITMNDDVERVKHEMGLDVESIYTWNRGFAHPTFIETLIKALKEKGCPLNTIGVEMELPIARGLLTVPEYFALTKEFNNSKFVDVVDTLDRIISINDKPAIEYIRRACEIGDIGIEAAIGAIGIGKTETQVAAAADYAMRFAGNEFSWSETSGTEIASGYRAYYYHGVCHPASQKFIQRGDMIAIDVHPTYNNYINDSRCTAILGTPNADQLTLEKFGQEIMNRVIEAIKPGVPMKKVSLIGREIETSHEYGKFAVPTFGHGFGPCSGGMHPNTINEESENIFEENQIMVIHKHIPIPKLGTWTFEMPILVVKDGVELLGKFPLEVRRIEV